MKQTLQNILAFLARKIIKKYRPTIIGITGSVGKTSAKEAIFCVVSQKFRTGKSEKNFNNEFGLPLTIIEADAPGKNIFAWLRVLFKALNLILSKYDYPEFLVLEMGVDKPGDMDYLLSIAKPHISVITSIGLSHYEFFKTAEAIENEKGKIAKILNADDILVVNADDAPALNQKSKTPAKTISYGLTEGADISAEHISLKNENGNFETTLTVKTATQSFPITVRALGEGHTSSVLCAMAVGEQLGIEPALLQKGAEAYKPLPGRLNAIAGIKQSLVLDDTYNSAPFSTLSALKMLRQLSGAAKIAALGDMLELGEISDEQHEEIGKLVAHMHVDKLITVGAQGKRIAQAAREAGMADVTSFDTSTEAGTLIRQEMPPHSVVLVKGSQGMRMEKISKEIMAEPEKARELLCRQDGKWLKN